MTLRSDPHLVYDAQAASDPTTTDDKTKLYAVGCRWLNTATGNSFVCKDSTAGAAVWVTIPTTVAATVIPAGGVTTTKLGAGAATLAKQTVAGKLTTIIRGKNGAGAITGLVGAVIGMRVESVTFIGTAADKLLPTLAANTGNALAAQPNALFEAAISSTDQLAQASASDLSANLYYVVLVPAAS